MILITNIGVLMGYGIGSYFPFSYLPLIMIPFPILFIITMCFIPDSPQYLVSCHRLQEAETALKYFRNAREDNSQEMEAIHAELQLFKDVIEERKELGEKLTLQDFSESPIIN
jgi:hypothetical protein